MPQDQFLGTLFTASLAFGAILFGVFGIFYSVYALYASTEAMERAAVCYTLRSLCRMLAVFAAITLAGVLVPLWYLTPNNLLDQSLSVSLAVPAAGLTAVSLVWAFKYME